MTIRALTAGLVAACLAGCGNKAAVSGSGGPEAAPTQTATVNAKEEYAHLAADAPEEAAAPPPAPQAPVAVATARIAYSYSLGFEVPTARLDAVLRRHRAACDALGPAHCQLINAARTGGGGDAAEASLDLRLLPADVRPFEARLTASATDAGGKVLSDSIKGEDLTRALIDADAALKAKRTLRDRLQTLLENHQGRLADLLEVEKALSATQQELDTATAELAELRQRVDFSTLAISYRSTRPLGSTARPLADAVANAGTTISSSLALLLTTALAVLPWLLPLGLLVWLLGRWRVWLRERRLARKE